MYFRTSCVSCAPSVLNFAPIWSLKLNLIHGTLKSKTKTLAPVIGTTAVYSKS